MTDIKRLGQIDSKDIRYFDADNVLYRVDIIHPLPGSHAKYTYIVSYSSDWPEVMPKCPAVTLWWHQLETYRSYTEPDIHNAYDKALEIIAEHRASL